MKYLELVNIGKSYRQFTSEWTRMLSWYFPIKPLSENWTLRNISFSVNEGEAIGVVGQNGAGKSTLLKIIAGTTTPNEGNLSVQGKVAAILELGMGFNPDMSGRANAVTAMGVMGFSSEESEGAIPFIENFSELGEYFDQPLRVYSSGMQMRLAFSVATAIRPNILIIDEALAVGDTYFQHKSFDRIKKFREEGTNLLIVSHDRASIQALCDRAILLEKGRILKDGNPEEVMDYYNAIIAEKESGTINTSKSVNGKIQTISGTKQATVANIYMTDCDGQLKEVLRVGDYAYLIVEIDIHDDLPALVLGYMIKDRLGQIMYGTNTWHTGQVVGAPRRGDRLKFRIKFQIVFGAGSYSIATALVSTDTHMSDNYEWKELALVFNVVNESKTYFIGSTWNEPVIDLEKI